MKILIENRVLQDLRKTSIFIQVKAHYAASSGVDLGVNEQRSKWCNDDMDKKTKFFVSPDIVA